jgi:hypothetical protein
VLDEKWPLTYLQLYGPAVVEDDFPTTVDVMMSVAEIMPGQPLPETVRPDRRGQSPRGAPGGDPAAAAVERVHTAGASQRGDDGSEMQHGLAERMA